MRVFAEKNNVCLAPEAKIVEITSVFRDLERQIIEKTSVFRDSEFLIVEKRSVFRALERQKVETWNET